MVPPPKRKTMERKVVDPLMELVDIVFHFKLDEKFSVHYWCFYFMIKHWYKDPCTFRHLSQQNQIIENPNEEELKNSKQASTYNENSTLITTASNTSPLTTSNQQDISISSAASSNNNSNNKTATTATAAAAATTTTTTSKEEKDESDEDDNDEYIVLLLIGTMGSFFVAVMASLIDDFLYLDFEYNRDPQLTFWQQTLLLCIFLGSQMFLFLLTQLMNQSLKNTKYSMDSELIEFCNVFICLFIPIGCIINSFMYLLFGYFIECVKIFMLGTTCTICQIYILIAVVIYFNRFKTFVNDFISCLETNINNSNNNRNNNNNNNNNSSSNNNEVTKEYYLNQRTKELMLQACINTRFIPNHEYDTIIQRKQEPKYKILANKNNDKQLKISKSVSNKKSSDLDIDSKLGVKLNQVLQTNILLLNKLCKCCVISLTVAINITLLWVRTSFLILYDTEWLENGNRLPFRHMTIFASINMLCIVLFYDFTSVLYKAVCCCCHRRFAAKAF